MSELTDILDSMTPVSFIEKCVFEWRGKAREHMIQLDNGEELVEMVDFIAMMAILQDTMSPVIENENGQKAPYSLAMPDNLL